MSTNTFTTDLQTCDFKNGSPAGFLEKSSKISDEKTTSLRIFIATFAYHYILWQKVWKNSE